MPVRPLASWVTSAPAGSKRQAQVRSRMSQLDISAFHSCLPLSLHREPLLFNAVIAIRCVPFA